MSTKNILQKVMSIFKHIKFIITLSLINTDNKGCLDLEVK